MMVGSHDHLLVSLSVLISIVAAFTALGLAARMRPAVGWVRRGWIAAAASALGGGIWSMHFVAMLAFSLPDVNVRYDAGLTALSFVLPIVVTGLGFLIVDRRAPSLPVLSGAGAIMGAGIVAMHYTGMAAMQTSVELHYDAVWVTSSILIAISASIAALWVAFRRTGTAQKVTASILMGSAIAGMHYTGMKAATFSTGGDHSHRAAEASLGQTSLALGVTIATLGLLLTGLAAAGYDRRMARLLEREHAARRESALADAYRRGEAFKAAILDAAFDCIITINSDDQIVDWNRAAIHTFGYSAEAAIGQCFAQLVFPPEHRPEYSQCILDLLNGHVPRPVQKRVELTAKRSDGSLFPAELAISRIHVEGTPHFTAYLRDISERARLEEQLRQSQKMEAIGQLTGGIAHDFNNLLTVVIGHSEALLDELAGPEQRRLAQITLEAAERGAALNQQLLSFARRQALKPERLILRDVVQGMLTLLERTLGEHIAIDVIDHSRPDTAALADRPLLESALLNLALNAKDAMPNGGRLVIKIGAIVSSKTPHTINNGKDFAFISVSDTGAGMSPDVLSKAFEPFYTTKEVGKGSGLGLSMVYGFTRQSGGDVAIESDVGIGTTVTIFLPALDHISPVPVINLGHDIRGGNETILIVEDEPGVRQFTASALSRLGYQITTFPTAIEALKCLEGGRLFDLLLSDVVLPGGLNGVELMRNAAHLNPKMKIILTSGYPREALPDHRDSDLEILLLRKPYRRAALANTVRAVLDGKTGSLLPFRSLDGSSHQFGLYTEKSS